MERILTDPETTAYLGLADGTLATWRCRGCGPKFRKLGAKAVRYRESDIEEFVGRN